MRHAFHTKMYEERNRQGSPGAYGRTAVRTVWYDLYVTKGGGRLRRPVRRRHAALSAPLCTQPTSHALVSQLPSLSSMRIIPAHTKL